MLQKYDIGDRDRDEINLLVKLDPTNEFGATATYITSRDTYKTMSRHIPTDTDSILRVNYPTATGLNDLYGLDDSKMDSIGLDYAYSDGKSTYSFSGADVARADLSNITNITNKFSTLNANLDYHFSEAFSPGLSYMYEKFDIDYFQLNNVDLYYQNGTDSATNGDILLGVGDNSHDVSVVSVVTKFKF